MKPLVPGILWVILVFAGIEKGGQIVLTSDRQPKEIPSLSERLVTRFESGLIADIQSPDLETRVAILDKRIKSEELNVPRDVLTFIAEVCKDNVRQLEGGLNRVVAFSSLMKSTIRLELAHEILRFLRTDEGELFAALERVLLQRRDRLTLPKIARNSHKSLLGPPWPMLS